MARQGRHLCVHRYGRCYVERLGRRQVMIAANGLRSLLQLGSSLVTELKKGIMHCVSIVGPMGLDPLGCLGVITIELGASWQGSKQFRVSSLSSSSRLEPQEIFSPTLPSGENYSCLQWCLNGAREVIRSRRPSLTCLAQRLPGADD